MNLTRIWQETPIRGDCVGSPVVPTAEPPWRTQWLYIDEKDYPDSQEQYSTSHPLDIGTGVTNFSPEYHKELFRNFFFPSLKIWGTLLVAQSVDELCYKPEGRGFDSRWGHWNFFYRHNNFGRTMALGSTQPRIEMSTGSISCGVKAIGVYGLWTLPSSWVDCLEIWEPNILEPSGPVRACNGIELLIWSLYVHKDYGQTLQFSTFTHMNHYF